MAINMKEVASLRGNDKLYEENAKKIDWSGALGNKSEKEKTFKESFNSLSGKEIMDIICHIIGNSYPESTGTKQELSKYEYHLEIKIKRSKIKFDIAELLSCDGILDHSYGGHNCLPMPIEDIAEWLVRGLEEYHMIIWEKEEEF